MRDGTRGTGEKMNPVERLSEIRARESAKTFNPPKNGGKNDSQLKTDFILVVRNYQCPADEIEIMKELVRRDPSTAAISFRAMAAEIESS